MTMPIPMSPVNVPDTNPMAGWVAGQNQANNQSGIDLGLEAGRQANATGDINLQNLIKDQPNVDLARQFRTNDINEQMNLQTEGVSMELKRNTAQAAISKAQKDGTVDDMEKQAHFYNNVNNDIKAGVRTFNVADPGDPANQTAWSQIRNEGQKYGITMPVRYDAPTAAAFVKRLEAAPMTLEMIQKSKLSEQSAKQAQELWGRKADTQIKIAEIGLERSLAMANIKMTPDQFLTSIERQMSQGGGPQSLTNTQLSILDQYNIDKLEYVCVRKPSPIFFSKRHDSVYCRNARASKRARQKRGSRCGRRRVCNTARIAHENQCGK